jgi:hypothetical protein
MEPSQEIIKWLFQQGVLGVVLVLVLIDYRRMYNQLVKKLEADNGRLDALVQDNTKSNVELQMAIEQNTKVIEELNPRPRWPERRDGDRRQVP